MSLETASAQTLEMFISSYPNGPYTEEARDMLEILREEEETAWLIATRRNTKDALLLFVRRHPDSRHAVSAQARMAILQEDRPSLEALAEEHPERIDEILKLLAPLPLNDFTTRASSRLAQLRVIVVDPLTANKNVGWKMKPTGPKRVDCLVWRKKQIRVSFVVPKGTLLLDTNAVPVAIAIDDASILLDDDRARMLRLHVASCAPSRELVAAPEQESVKKAPGHVKALLEFLQGEQASFSVFQAAIWIAMANADFAEMGNIRGIAIPGEPPPRTIDEEAAAQALHLCTRAGIDVVKTRLWQERKKLLDGKLSDKMRTWLNKESPRTE